MLVARPLGDGDDDGYYVFGGVDVWWMVHRIGAAPSFDAIARVRLDGTPEAGRFRIDHVAVGATIGAATITAVDEVSCLVGPDFTTRCQPDRSNAR